MKFLYKNHNFQMETSTFKRTSWYLKNDLADNFDSIFCHLEILVDGFVFGCLSADGTVDENACEQLIRVCPPSKPITFHRAFDVTKVKL